MESPKQEIWCKMLPVLCEQQHESQREVWLCTALCVCPACAATSTAAAALLVLPSGFVAYPFGVFDRYDTGCFQLCHQFIES